MIVYLAGPINGCSDSEAVNWREEMKARMSNMTFLDPMRRDYRGREDDCVDEIVYGDIDDIAKSNVVLANCWRPSFGTAMEIYHAYTNIKLPVIVWTEAGKPVSPWLRKFSDYIVHFAIEAESVLIRLCNDCPDCGGTKAVLCDTGGVSIMKKVCPRCRA